MAMLENGAGSDQRLVAIFYKKPLPNEFKTAQEGRPIFDEVDMVKIYVAGDNLSVIDTLAREDHKQRFPLQWAQFMNKTGNDPHLSGTPLSQWPLVSQSQVEELKGLKFFTVEQVASASDQQISRIGMLAGMSPHAFRDRAINFLKVAKDESDANKQEEELAKLREENARIKQETDAKMAEMQAKFESQMSSLLAAVGEKKPRSRKAKVAQEE